MKKFWYGVIILTIFTAGCAPKQWIILPDLSTKQLDLKLKMQQEQIQQYQLNDKLH